jgi:ABC-2 type transport system ATP-binding protein
VEAGTETGVSLVSLGGGFGREPAIRELDLRVEAGELFGLLGPNGAGKTTTISILATLLRPSSGDVRVFGESVVEAPARVRQLVGLAPQQLAVYPDLAGEANVRFFGELHGLKGSELRERAGECLEQVGLSARARELARTYSGGMLRRLNLACALVHSPRLLLLDEPTVGVDPQSRDNLLRVIREVADGGTTVIYTSHYMEEAERLCDRIGILDEGRLLAQGRLEELLAIVGLGEIVEIRDVGQAIDTRLWQRVAGIRDVRRDESTGTTRLVVERAAEALGPIGGLLMQSGASEAEIRVYPVNLERVFLHLTGRELRD